MTWENEPFSWGLIYARLRQSHGYQSNVLFSLFGTAQRCVANGEDGFAAKVQELEARAQQLAADIAALIPREAQAAPAAETGGEG